MTAVLQSRGQERGCGRRPSRSMSAGPGDLDSFRRFRCGEAAATGLSGTYVFRVVAAQATERGLQSAGVLVREGGFGICGRVCAVLTFLRDKSRAPAAILVGALNTYVGEADGGFAFPLARKRSLGRRDACPTNLRECR